MQSCVNVRFKALPVGTRMSDWVVLSCIPVGITGVDYTILKSNDNNIITMIALLHGNNNHIAKYYDKIIIIINLEWYNNIVLRTAV